MREFNWKELLWPLKRLALEPKRQFRKFQVRQLLAQSDRNPEEAVLLVSEPRAGSTWIFEQMANAWTGPISFEPFQGKYGHARFPLPNRRWPFIDPDYPDPTDVQAVKRALVMEAPGAWEVRHYDLSGYGEGNGVLMKSVRATFLLPFLLQQNRFKHKPLVVLRHPVHVALSQARAFGPLNREGLLLSINHPLRKRKVQLTVVPQSDFQERVLHTAIAAEFVLTNPVVQAGCDVIHYESVVLHGPAALKRTAFEVQPKRWSNAASSTVYDQGELMKGASQLEKGFERLKEEDQTFITDLWRQLPGFPYPPFSAIPRSELD